MIDQVKVILQEALDKLTAVSIPSLPRDGMTVRQALEALRSQSDGLVSLRLEFESLGAGKPFTLAYQAYNEEYSPNGFSNEKPHLADAVLQVLPQKPQPDALQTVDSILECVTEPMPF